MINGEGGKHGAGESSLLFAPLTTTRLPPLISSSFLLGLELVEISTFTHKKKIRITLKNCSDHTHKKKTLKLKLTVCTSQSVLTVYSTIFL